MYVGGRGCSAARRAIDVLARCLESCVVATPSSVRGKHHRGWCLTGLCAAVGCYRSFWHRVHQGTRPQPSQCRGRRCSCPEALPPTVESAAVAVGCLLVEVLVLMRLLTLLVEDRVLTIHPAVGVLE